MGLHIYLSTEIINDPDFKLKDKDVIILTPNKDGIEIRKVDMSRLGVD